MFHGSDYYSCTDHMYMDEETQLINFKPEGVPILSLNFVQICLYAINKVTCFTVFLLNIFEWICMWYIIGTQSKRNVNEILYDFNTENLDDNESSLSYRKNELRMRNGMIYAYVILMIMLVITTFVYFMFKETWSMWFFNFYVSLYIVVGLGFFVSLMQTMKKSHKFEYNRVKVEMRSFFAIKLLYLLMFYALNILSLLDIHVDRYHFSMQLCFDTDNKQI